METVVHSQTNGSAGSNSVASCDKLLNVVLVSPQIPGNTGCIARTCAASSVGLHLVEPLGYKIDDTKLKRAGLDYWPYVVVKVHGSWTEFREYFRQQEGDKRLLAFTKRGTNIHSDFSYKRGDWLVFGSETCGLPPETLTAAEKGWVAAPFAYQWLTPTFDALTSLLVLGFLYMKQPDS